MFEADIANILRSSGVGGVSIRSVALELGVPAANVQYRYGTKSRLLEKGIRVVVERRVKAIGELRAQIPVDGMGMPGLAHLMRVATVGDGNADRLDSLVLLELLVGGVAEAHLRLLAGPWISSLEQLWRKASSAAGRDDVFAGFLADLQFGLMLHFCSGESRSECNLVCNEIIDRCFLGTPVAECVWFRAFHARSLKAIPDAIDTSRPLTASTAEILTAAMRIVVMSGPRALTYRTLAAQAGLSASAVAHHFRNREALLYATYRFLHHKIIERTRAEVGRSTGTDPAAALRIAGHAQAGGLPDLVTYSAFEIFANQHPEFSELARFFRMTRGAYHLRKRDSNFDPYGAEAYDSFAHSFSLLGYLIRTLAVREVDHSAPDDLARVELALRHFRIGSTE